MVELNATKLLLDKIRKKTISLNSTEKKEAWVIFVDGKQAKFENGKFVWSSLRNAKAALTDKVKHYFIWEMKGAGYSWEVAENAYYETIKELQENATIEFRRLD